MKRVVPKKNNVGHFYSPAKINLFFRVLKKRSDGYHEIASLYQAINLFDILSFSQSAQDFCSANIDLGEENLVTKALALFRSRFPFPFKIHIRLEKRIPVGAGLGGGSSNAATTLWALNELTGRRASFLQLIEMGALLGADVAFFFSTGTAYCTGRGEILEPFMLPYPITGFLAKPHFGLSTPLVYQNVSPDELPARDPRLGLIQFPFFYNDLENAAFQIEPRLEAFRNSLLKMQFDSVTMTGSGSAFVCIGKEPKEIRKALLPFTSIQRTNGLWYDF